MKLTKFILEKMPDAEINAIKAGSGWSGTHGAYTMTTANDVDTGQNDQSWPH